MARKSTRRVHVPSIDLLEDRLAPAVFTVNTTADPQPGQGNWALYNAAGCSLRWAIMEMNNPGSLTQNPAPNPPNQPQAANTINIANMGGQGGEIRTLFALPAINANVEIVGPGAGVVSLVRDNNTLTRGTTIT